jgi:hypothetical protein
MLRVEVVAVLDARDGRVYTRGEDVHEDYDTPTMMENRVEQR